MLLKIAKVIDADMVSTLREMISGGEFVSGLKTAAGSAAQVKDNEQLDVQSDVAQQAGQLLIDKLRQNPVFKAATLPARVLPPRFSRYQPGMRYGDHLDAPLMLDLPPLRTDIAVTIFLADPSSYDGGELAIDTDYGIQHFKGGAGDCIIYPADTVHRVEPVSRGERIVSFFWIQSLVRDPEKRRILFDLAGVIEFLDQTSRPGLHVETLRRCNVNLIRMWADA
jgi:PKHD-type hydroxylase